MISPPDGYFIAVILVFVLAGLSSFMAAAVGFFVQKRPLLAPALVALTGLLDFLFIWHYTITVGAPWFGIEPDATVIVRKNLLLIGLTLLIIPFGFLVTGNREIKLLRKSAEDVEYQKRLAQRTIGHLESELETVRAEKKESQRVFDELKRLIITNVRHELQTPMAISLGFIDMIFTGTFGVVVDTPLHEPLSTVHTNTRRMSAVVDRMINVVREPHFQSTDLATIARQVLVDPDIWLNTRREKEIVSISSDIPDHLYVVGDTQMLRSLISDLLNNAIKFGANNISLTLVEKDGEAILVVADDGIGISRKFHKKIFDPLFQIQMSGDRRYEGAGMGLAVVDAVAQAHDGFVKVESRLGQGATFTFTMPAQQSMVPPMDVAVDGKD